MDLTATMNEIATLNVDERMRLIEAIWDSFESESDEPALTDAQKAELERRLSAYRASPNDVFPAEHVEAAALARARR